LKKKAGRKRKKEPKENNAFGKQGIYKPVKSSTIPSREKAAKYKTENTKP